jgi:hypothetical protein
MARVETFLHLKTTPDGVCVCKLERQQIWDATRVCTHSPASYSLIQ